MPKIDYSKEIENEYTEKFSKISKRKKKVYKKSQEDL